jgi:amino acid adenylation domain-containing protein
MREPIIEQGIGMENGSRTQPGASELSAAKQKLIALLAKDREQRARPIDGLKAEKPCDLSFGQRRLWFLDRWSPGSTTYNEFVRLRLHGRLEVEALRQSLAMVVQRHEVLRTVFQETREGTVQVLDPRLMPALEQHDLATLPKTEQESALDALLQHEMTTPFNLAAGPLVRARLVHLGTDEHELLFSVHHIACDGWSLGIFVRELGAGYTAFVNGEAPPLPPLDIQYADYARWQREAAHSPSAMAQLEYWKRQLPEPAPVLDLPFARPRPDVRTPDGITRFFSLSADLTSNIRRLARKENATPFMVLLAAFHALLHRYTGETDIRVGSPVAGRSRGETEPLIGFFVNTLVMRGDVAGEPTFRELLQRVRDTALAAYANQDVPFEQLVETLRPKRDVNHTPLFQALFVLQNSPLGAFTLPGLQVIPIEVDRGTSKFDITLSLTETDEGFKGGFECSADLFNAADIERMCGHFVELLASTLETPDERVCRLRLLSQSERHNLLYEWNDTAAEYPKEKCLHALFEEQVLRTPDAIAVVFEGEEVSYGELNRRANRLGHHLRKLGVKPDSLVAICAERSVEMVVGLLGVLKAGGAYVPLDPAYPAERLRFMLKDSEPVALLAQRSVVGILGALPENLPVVLLDGDGWKNQPESNPVAEVGLSSSHLAYVIYTSGSTGMPKGVMVEHHPVVNRMVWMQAAYCLQPSEPVVQKTPFSFDVSVWEFFWPLLFGARLVVARPQGHMDPAYLRKLIVQNAVTTAHFVPSMLQVFLNDPLAANCTCLRRVICSGEALSTSLAERFFAVLPNTELHNLYGPTEAVVDVSAHSCTPAKLRNCNSVPIGKPITNTRFYVLDALGEPVPAGVTGELFIGGTQLARGYLNRPELTAERFVRDPFVGEAGARMYRTGDLGRWLPDGSIEYLGRNDQQVKIRGFRIELGEIEARLQEHEGVREAVVLAREDHPGDKRLVAYFAGAEGITASELRAHLSAALPEYMVPAAYVRLETLPLTPNGKLDRKALPTPSDAVVLAPAERAPVAGELETLIAHEWKAVLQVDVVGATDNFFDAGGNSLHMATLQARMFERLGREVPMVALFKYPTIRDLARHLAGVQTNQGDTPSAGQATARAGRRSDQTSRRDLRRANRNGGSDE